MNIFCYDADQDGAQMTPACGVTVQKSYGPDVDTHAWEPKSRIQTPLISDTSFVKQESGPVSVKFYGEEASKISAILPPGGLRITGGLEGGGNEITVDFTCKTGQMGSMREPGAVCEIARN
jgi:hypothetical protein